MGPIEMEEFILNKEPELHNPYMVAAWPGMGGVAIIAARYLAEKLGAEELGSISPEGFFDIGGVLIENNVVQDISFPENNLYLARDKGKRDWIIYIGEAQPMSNSYRMANLILDVAQRFNVQRLYTFAAAPTHIYHTKKPKVLGAVTRHDLLAEPSIYDIAPLKEGSISGLNGLMLGVAKKRGIEGVCLLGEIPIYTTNIANPRSSAAVIEVLSKMTGLEIDMSDIEKWSQDTDSQIEEKIQQLKESFGEEAQGLIDYFDQLAEQTGVDEIQQGYRAEELHRDIERFLKDQGDNKEEH